MHVFEDVKCGVVTDRFKRSHLLALSSAILSQRFTDGMHALILVVNVVVVVIFFLFRNALFLSFAELSVQ